MDTNAREEGRVAIAGKGQRQAMLRSVEAIIYFLGETHRARSETACGVPSQNDGWPYYTRKQSPLTITLLHLDKACSGGPVAFRTFMQTKFNDGTYYVRRFGDAPPADRTLTTLSFLNELIALQTSESSVVSATPVVAIGTR